MYTLEGITEEQLEAFVDTLQEEPKQEAAPFPGYEYPLACRELRSTDAQHLFRVMKRSAKHLKGYIGWAKYAPSWDYKTVQQFVNDHVNDSFPRFHLIFTIGKEVVGFGSLAPMGDPRSVQVALWTALGHERRGIGKWIVTVLEWYAFHVYGFDRVYYQHDATNRKSGKLPPALGYRFDHSFDDEVHAMQESGLWMSWVKDRPEGLPPGYIDTGHMGLWHKHTFPWKCLI
jgi:RimJ/RimL family protein N-acetyltransferase